jgi:hypothetical protein
METGLLAAEAVLPVRPRRRRGARRYEQRCGAEAALRASTSAAQVNRRPWLTDLVIWRGRRSPRILRRMSGVLDETQNPGRCSARGITKLIH